MWTRRTEQVGKFGTLRRREGLRELVQVFWKVHYRDFSLPLQISKDGEIAARDCKAV